MAVGTDRYRRPEGLWPDRPAGPRRPERLRVAFVAGALVQDGAEKQLVYMVHALRQAGAEVRVYCLTRGDFYEPVLATLGVPPCWVGRRRHPLLRLATLVAALWRFRPHVVQSAHFFTNPYATIPARLCGALGIACSRSDIHFDLRHCKGLGRWVLRTSPVYLVNSHAAKRNAGAFAIKPDRIHVLANVIDLAAFDVARQQAPRPAGCGDWVTAVALGRLIPEKRVECFLAALAEARRTVPRLKGLVVGNGPERGRLEEKAASLGLLPGHVEFLGRRPDVPALLGGADLLVHAARNEGFPNAVLEAMAAGLPVITTPAGDAGTVVQDGVTGYVVPFDGVGAMAEHMVRLAVSPELRRRLGGAGRRRVEACYTSQGLAERLLAAYQSLARQQKRYDLLPVLAGRGTPCQIL